MTTIALIAIIASAFFHSSYNMLIKVSDEKTIYMWSIFLVAIIAGWGVGCAAVPGEQDQVRLAGRFEPAPSSPGKTELAPESGARAALDPDPAGVVAACSTLPADVRAHILDLVRTASPDRSPR